MAPAPSVGEAFSPLDEQLGLLSGGLTPRGEEVLARLSTWMPFEPAREMLQDLLGVQVSKATTRRATLATGAAALAVWEAQVERLKQEVPQAPAGADKQVLSGDGAFVHLVGGEWAEVKTLAIGEVTRNQRGEVCTQQLSYCSRLCDTASFEQATLVETHRRGLERATAVCAVQDGAEWLQGLVDYHRADAVRILDFAHAAEYINDIRQAVQAAGGRLPARWLEGVLHRLKHQGPARVLRHLSRLAARYPSPLIQEKLTYVQKREAHMQYPTYQEADWPIGSGSVESANKLVVEARLKGAGMRLRSAERQSSAGAAQCGLQSSVEADLGGLGGTATNAAHPAAASTESATAGACLVVPCHLGRTGVSAVSSLWCCCSHDDGSGPPEAPNGPSWLWVLLAQTLSPTSPFRHWCYRRALCKKMKHTQLEVGHFALYYSMLYCPMKFVATLAKPVCL